MLTPTAEEALLDVGTGTAALLAALAQRDERPRLAVGVDASPEMLALAPALPATWRLEPGDATALRYADASFDCVTAAYLLHVLDADSRHRAIAELARVVRPGGRVGTVTIAPPRSAVARVLTAPVRRRARSSSGRLTGLRPLDPSPELAAAGLTVTATRRSLTGYPSLCVVATAG